MSSATAEPKTRRKRSTPPSSPSVDPVTQYALDVTERRTVAGRAVRLAGQRHLRDLARQRTPTFPFYFDETAARHIIDFYPQFLTLEDGSPFHLPPWLQFSYGSIYGWKCADGQRTGYRKYIHGFFETSKGSGKTPSAGGLALYGAAYDDEPYAEIYSTGFDKGQAAIILNDARRMAIDSPVAAFSNEFVVDKHNIAHPSSGSFVRAMSSQHQSKSGPRPHYVLSDEIHEHRDGTVVGKAESGFKRRLQPLALKYTNSGSDKSSYCWQLHEKSLQVLEGAVVDEQWFAYVCHLDPCQACYDEGYRQPKDGCPDCDDWTAPASWPKIAPALGIVIQPKYLQDAVDTALSIPSEYNLKRRLNFCIWTEAHQVWISSDRWDACKVATVADRNESRRCAMGFDMSEKVDLTAGVLALQIDDPPGEDGETVELVEKIGDQDVVKELSINFSVELIPFFWIPEETLHERERSERVPWSSWARLGAVRTFKGPVIDHDQIFTQMKNEIGPAFRPQRIGYDPHNATQFALALRDKAKFEIVEVPQGRRLSEAFKLFEALVRLRRIRHAGNPVMGYCVANAQVERDRFENMWVEKPHALKRVDGVIAAVMALQQLMLMPAKRQSVYATRGALYL